MRTWPFAATGAALTLGVGTVLAGAAVMIHGAGYESGASSTTSRAQPVAPTSRLSAQGIASSWCETRMMQESYSCTVDAAAGRQLEMKCRPPLTSRAPNIFSCSAETRSGRVTVQAASDCEPKVTQLWRLGPHLVQPCDLSTRSAMLGASEGAAVANPTGPS